MKKRLVVETAFDLIYFAGFIKAIFMSVITHKKLNFAIEF